MNSLHALDALVVALRRLPGVGEKSASRMAHHLMQHDRVGAQLLSQALSHAAQTVQHCTRCYAFTSSTLCETCLDPERDASRLCVVETPADQSAIERTQSYKGLYFVLMGALSPLNGMGPQDLGVKRFFGEGRGRVFVVVAGAGVSFARWRGWRWRGGGDRRGGGIVGTWP